MQTLGSTQWYTLRVKSRHERAVSKALEERGYESLLPLYEVRSKWSDRVQKLQLPLFPGYVFCRFDPHQRVPILNAPGVHEVVRTGRKLAPLDPKEIAALQKLVHSGLAAEPWPRLEVGEFVEIDKGPLEGCRGIVLEIRKRWRLLLAVTLLQRAVHVELEREWVRKDVPRKIPPHGNPIEKASAGLKRPA